MKIKGPADQGMSEATNGENLQNDRNAAIRRGLIKGGLSNSLARVAGVATSVASIPLVAKTLDTPEYAAYSVFMSLNILFSFVDFGIGSALLTEFSMAKTLEQRYELYRRALKSSFRIAGVVLAFATIAASIFDVRSILGVNSADSGQVFRAFVVLILCLALSVPARLAERVLLASGRSASIGIVQTLNSFVVLVGLKVAQELNSRLYVVLAITLGTQLLAWAIMHGLALPIWRGRITEVCEDDHSSRSMWRLGAPFFLLQLLDLVAFQTDILVVSHILSETDVVTYATGFRLFSLIWTTAALLMAPFWPVYGGLFTSGSMMDLRRLVGKVWRKSVAITVGAAMVLVVVGPTVAREWTDRKAFLTREICVLFGITAVLHVLRGALTMPLYAIGAQRVLLLPTALATAVNVVLSIWLTEIYGVAGPLYGNIAATCVVSLPSLVFFSQRFLGVTR